MPLMVKSRRWASSSRRAEFHLIGMPAVAVAEILPERGHFNLPRRARSEHRHYAESRSDRQRFAVRKHAADFLRFGAGGHVVIDRNAAQQLIAHATAGPIGLEPVIAQLGAPLRRRIHAVFAVERQARGGFGVLGSDCKAGDGIAGVRTVRSIAWFTCSIIRFLNSSFHGKENSAPVRKKCNVNSIGGCCKIFSTARAYTPNCISYLAATAGSVSSETRLVL